MNIINFSSSLKVLGVKTKITNVFDSIKGGEYANDISIYRDMLKNDKEMANHYKKQLACFTVSGSFNDKRIVPNLENYNSIIHLDYDLKDEDKAKGVVDLANKIPYTYCSFISPSFGVKIFVRTDSNESNHNNCFNQLSDFYDGILQVVSDRQVKDITRLCFVSDDPNLFLNQNSAKFIVESKCESDLENLWDFTSNRVIYEEGSRNRFIHLFSCNANRWSLTETDTYTYLVNRCDDLAENEILSTVNSAFKATVSESGKFGRVTKSSKDSKTYTSDNSGDYNLVNYDFESEDSPIISEEYYSKLPEVLREACNQFSGREKDVFLTGLITTLSSTMHNVTGVYDGGVVYPNLFSFVTAPAASGKGSIKYSKEILKCYHEAIRGSSEFDDQVFFIPANNSASKIYEMLEANGGIGLIFETEADTLSNSMKQEWGSFSDVLRKAFHNEYISQARRNNNEYFEVNEPKFSICLTGTNEQVGRLITSTEDGLFSRFLFYSFATEFKWKNTLMDIEPTKQIYFDKLNAKICDLLSQSKQRRFRLKESQIDAFNTCFEDLSISIGKSYPEALDQLKRAGLKVYKLAMTLSGFRYSKEDFVCNDDDFNFALNVVTKVYLPHQINVMRRLYGKTKNLSGVEYLLDTLPINFNRGNISEIYSSTTNPPSDKTISNYINLLIKQGKIIRVSQGKYKKRL
ncbi:hypothetical protein Flav3CDRAFT_0919 [Flavobacteria bacterium MS024-3C]|nr:hypothetical protein Flav3CDRAFT_0919 [Flavobacteria bacterium MS024-3C]